MTMNYFASLNADCLPLTPLSRGVVRRASAAGSRYHSPQQALLNAAVGLSIVDLTTFRPSILAARRSQPG
jgi:hypothetical protein